MLFGNLTMEDSSLTKILSNSCKNSTFNIELCQLNTHKRTTSWGYQQSKI